MKSSLGHRAASAVMPLLLTAVHSFVMAQDLRHEVRRGDTLYGLAQDYLTEPRRWPELQRLNGVRHPQRLQPGSVILIPAALAKPQPMPAEVLQVMGSATAVEGTGQPKSLAPGQSVVEGSRLDVARDGFLTLRLADGSIVQFPAGSQADLRRLRHSTATRDSVTDIELKRGRVESKVTPLPSPASRFEVRTPLAVGGVRGTSFGVSVADNGDFVGDVTEGAVAVTTTAANGPASAVRAGEGTRVGLGDARARVVPLLGAPILDAVPAVIEDVSFVEFAIPAQAGAVAFDVRIAASASFAKILRAGRVQDGAARFAGLDDGDYQLAVRAIDANGIPGLPGVRALRVKARPEPPLIRQPAHGSRHFSPDSLALLCTEGTGLIGYHLQVARNGRFEAPLKDAPLQETCALTLRDLAPGTYDWRVAAVRTTDGRRDAGPWSKPVRFQILALPSAPEGVAANLRDGEAITIAWAARGEGRWRYRLQMATDVAFTQPLMTDVVLEAPRFEAPFPDAGRYYVRVRQIEPEGHEGAWSSAQILDVPMRLLSGDQKPVFSGGGSLIRPGSP